MAVSPLVVMKTAPRIGLGLCATQYASEFMDAEIHRDGKSYKVHFKQGNPYGEMEVEEYSGKDTGSRIYWKPDMDVFTDINIPLQFFQDIIKRQAVLMQACSPGTNEQIGRASCRERVSSPV